MTTIHVDTSQYQFSHGKQPRGGRCWAFDIGQRGAWTTVFAPSYMKYAEASKWAQGKAVEMGCFTVCVAP